MTPKQWTAFTAALSGGTSDTEMGLIADLAATQKRAEKAEAREAALVEALEEYGAHQIPCVLALWHEGRPTKDGGYETRYGDKWYQQNEKPPCTCGLDAALAKEGK